MQRGSALRINNLARLRGNLKRLTILMQLMLNERIAVIA
jgi:hypothetical protein